MTVDPWPELHVTKLDAARRNLEMAIRLLFEQADAVSVYTLAHASFTLLKDLAKHRGKSRVLDAANELAKGERIGAYWKAFNHTGSFLKHADNDPEGVLTGIPEEENEAVISLAVDMYRDLDGVKTPETESFYLWWRCIHYADIDDVREPFESWLTANSVRLESEERSELLALGRSLLILLRDSTINGGTKS